LDGRNVGRKTKMDAYFSHFVQEYRVWTEVFIRNIVFGRKKYRAWTEINSPRISCLDGRNIVLGRNLIPFRPYRAYPQSIRKDAGKDVSFRKE
jgi:hypothetical protein